MITQESQTTNIALDFTLTYITKGGACRYDEERSDPDVQPKVGALYIREWAWKLQGLEPPKRVRMTVEQA